MKPEIEVARVKIRRAGWAKNRWRAVSSGVNNEKIAWTQTYKKLADAEAAAQTIADGAPIHIEEM